MTEITVKQLDDLIDECFRLQDEHKELKKETSLLHAKLTTLQEQAIAHLQDLGKTSFKSPRGNFSFSVRETFKMPKSPEDRTLFFNYLKDKGVFEGLVSVNAATLNTWAKTEIESSEELDMQIPGLEKSDPTFRPSMRK